jgi:Uma2 family endonuclease
MTVHAPLTMTKEAFFAWVGQREERYEYARGRVVMMVYVTRNHARVTKNLVVALATRLSADSYDIVSADFAVDVGESVRFPDVLVEPRQPDGKALEAKLPLLIAEVLSPGTYDVDFADKRTEYLSLSSLESYVILAPDEPKIWLWRRHGGHFPVEPQTIEGADQHLALPAFGIEIPLAELYRGVA